MDSLRPQTTFASIIVIASIGIFTAVNVFGATTAYLPPTTQPTAPLATPLGSCQTAHVASGVQGFSGHYFNMAETDPGMLTDTPYYSGPPIPNPVAGSDNYWYTSPYFAFSRVDRDVNFGKDFFPVDTGKAGDPYHFAVHWQAHMDVPVDGSYKFAMESNDDSWFYVDGALKIDLSGIHAAKKSTASLKLTQGLHTVDLYFADRARAQSVFTFTPDSRATFYVVAFPCPTNGAVPPPAPTPQGRVLGASTMSYTPTMALYKTAASSTVYAIYSNGQRHSIPNPASFIQYGHAYSRVNVVSQKELNRHPEARLVRTPESSTVYFLFRRPNNQWLKFPIPSSAAFISYPKNKWGNIAVINSLDLNAYPTAKLVRVIGTQDVHLVRNGERHLFLSPEIFESLGYSATDVVDISEAHLQSFALADPIG